MPNPLPLPPRPMPDSGVILLPSTCRACDAPITFRRTAAGRWQPMDPDNVTPHFATCSEAERFRKPPPPDNVCLACGSLDVERLPGTGQHYAAIRCRDCQQHRWLRRPVA